MLNNQVKVLAINYLFYSIQYEKNLIFPYLETTKLIKRCILPSGSQFAYWDTTALLNYKNLSTNTRILYNSNTNGSYFKLFKCLFLN